MNSEPVSVVVAAAPFRMLNLAAFWTLICPLVERVMLGASSVSAPPVMKTAPVGE